MTQSNFEKNGGTYTQVGDYLIPNLTVPPENDTRPIGVWGRRHYEYLKNHRTMLEKVISNRAAEILNK